MQSVCYMRVMMVMTDITKDVLFQGVAILVSVFQKEAIKAVLL